MKHYIDEFTDTRPQYDSFRVKLSDLISELIKDAGIEIVSIDSRTKSINSFKEKIERPEKNYKNPLEQITDLCGIRIITYYTEDIYKIANLLEGEFKIDNENSIDKTKVDSPDRFGYLSLHYILKLNDQRNGLIEWRNFKNFNAEIQVRSILQHSWAAIDHKLRYKSKKEIPSSLRRKIFRLSALLELADEEFLSIKKQTQELHSEIENSIEQGNLEIEFNAISIISYIEENNLVEDIVKIAVSLGYIQGNEDLLDEETQQYFLTRLIATLDHSDLNSIRKLDNFLNSIFPSIEDKLFRLKKSFEDISDQDLFAINTDLILILLVLSKETNIDIKNPRLRNRIGWQPLLDCFDHILSN